MVPNCWGLVLRVMFRWYFEHNLQFFSSIFQGLDTTVLFPLPIFRFSLGSRKASYHEEPGQCLCSAHGRRVEPAILGGKKKKKERSSKIFTLGKTTKPARAGSDLC